MSSRPTSATNAVDSATPPTRTALIWTALVLVYLLWGSTYLGIRVAVESLPPLISAAMRFAGAAVVLAVVLRLRRGPGALRVPVRRVGSAALIGVLLLAGGNGLVVLAESGPAGTAVPSGVAALLVATVPLLVVVLRTVGGDRPRPWTFLGVALGFAGLVVLVLPRDGVDGVPVAGALTVVAAATSWSVGSYLSGRIRMPADPFVATVYEMLAGAAVLALVGVARGELRGFSFAEVTGRSWAALAYLMVAGSLVAFTAYVWLLAHAPNKKWSPRTRTCPGGRGGARRAVRRRTDHLASAAGRKKSKVVGGGGGGEHRATPPVPATSRRRGSRGTRRAVASRPCRRCW
ncbi:transporter, EamA family [Micromonospora sp. M42]|uniref:EamA family transporter n=1 Tax=Micromonospora sp. M42 TaxID=457406 RepID=UPI0003EED434|nr:EamA family transporter [Micromonospora sp. M42]EWM66854.1 transporter, EamA family [Micromonospora sp. M42]